MEVEARTTSERSAMPRFFNLEMLMFTLVVLSGMVLVWTLATPQYNIVVMAVAGVVFTLSLVMVIRLVMDPDSVRARQSDSMLRLASQTLDCMKNGMTSEAAQTICTLLLPSTAGIAVAITDRETILGYAGFLEAENPSGSVIRTHATHATIADGVMRILRSSEEIGFQPGSTIQGAIIVPLVVGDDILGTLKFYYRHARDISETQKSIAEGFGRLLSTQMAAAALEEQKKLAASMELKALQSQINPHFLFNTINTIASLVRTDPPRARVLLREFAVFYRRTLEDSADLILFEREMEQTRRYFTFEIARFGAVRYRKMFGDATVYLDDKPILLVCDNTVFVKCLPETAALLSDAGTGTPYDGARPHYLLDIDNAALLDVLIPVLAACTPLPKPRKKKVKT